MMHVRAFSFLDLCARNALTFAALRPGDGLGTRCQYYRSPSESLLEAVEARGVMARWVARDTTSKRYFDITTDSVCISTIHSAKGLDFSHVFLLGMDRLQPEKPRQRRLAYVGMTRAREHLTLAICGREGLVPVLAAAER